MPAVSDKTAADQAEQVHRIPVERILPNPHQPRKQFDEARLQELAQSVRELGILEPLILKPIGEGLYELVAGERRLRAAQLCGQTEVPALLRNFESLESLEVALIENLQREDLNPVEEARAYQQLAEEFGRTHAEISQAVGKDRTTITNLLRLLRLPPEILQEVSRGTLSAGHARVLLSLQDQDRQIALAQTILREGWSVRQTEQHVAKALRKRDAGAPRQSHEDPVGPEVLRVQEALRYSLGTEVRLFHGERGGRIEIRYSSREELERLLELMGVQVH